MALYGGSPAAIAPGAKPADGGGSLGGGTVVPCVLLMAKADCLIAFLGTPGGVTVVLMRLALSKSSDNASTLFQTVNVPSPGISIVTFLCSTGTSFKSDGAFASRSVISAMRSSLMTAALRWPSETALLVTSVCASSAARTG